MAKPSRPSTARNGRTESPKGPDIEDKEQSARFVETARLLEVDESGESFDRAVKTLLPNGTKSST